ncbi:MAG TPA: DMT family transporter [Beijerinckiaceae bacterium]|nr:DMT family transporter [Beijerinckiaceae bacterium]
MQPLLGIALKIASALAFTLMSAGVKLVAERYPIGEVVFFRSAFALVPLLAWLSWRGDLINAVRTDDLKGHLLRGIISTSGMFAGFIALSYLPLSDAVAIGYASPLITVVLAALILKETVRAYRWSAVVVGFVGVIIMLLPHLNGSIVAQGLAGGAGVGALFALFAACCSAGATIQIRRLMVRERTGAIVFYFSLLTTFMGLMTIVLGWRMPDLADAVLLVVIGILGGIGQILLTLSYRHADTSVIAPFEYTTMLWAVLIGWFAFSQLPQATVVAGGLIVAAAGCFVLWRERQLGLQRAKEVEVGAQRHA